VLRADVQGGLAMNPGIAELFRSVTVTQPQTVGGLTVFGLRTERPSKLSYTTLDDALKSEALTITEISEGGSVPTLKLTNKTGRRVFMMAGEQLIGSKQNRVLNTSLLVEIGAEIPIPVSCVEQGRWTYRSEKFKSHGTSSPGELRKMMSRDVSRFYLCESAPTSDQGAVWAKISKLSASLGTRSDSGAMEQIYSDHGPRLDEKVKKLECPQSCNGVIFVRNGKIVGADVFDQPETLRKLWTKLLRAQLLDILAEPETTTTIPEPTVVRQWLDSASKAEAKAYQSPALGEDVRLKGEHLEGAGLVVEEQPVHVQVFAE
jgi:ARG/rhodanese/phosphatase superfamily protein